MVIGIPPIVHRATPTANDVVVAWVIIGVIVALVLVATITLVIAAYRSVQRQAQMKEAKQLYEASLQPQGGEQPQVPAPEEKILVGR
jgi:NADH:ubiquinone oxidoreductase subunit 3 (subunit A)